MKCMMCGNPMTETRGEYAYASLPGVTLANVAVFRCDACGEEEVSIPRIDELNRAIAQELVTRPTSLQAAEIRFLRKFLGWSGTDFANHFGVQPETVSRWENGKKAIGPTAERLLRLCVATRSPVKNYDLDTLERISSDEKPSTLRFRTSQLGWAPASTPPAA